MQTLSKFNDSPDPKEQLVFLHANGFPPDTYATFLSCISPLGQISTIEHRPLWQTEAPQFLDWGVYASDAIATLRREAKTPVWLVGHSMGGAISLLIAKAAPDLVKGVVALTMEPLRTPKRVWFMSSGSAKLRPPIKSDIVKPIPARQATP